MNQSSSIGRKILATCTGLLAGGCAAAAIQAISNFLYAKPGLDYSDPEQLRAFVQSLPTAAFLIVLLSWLVAPFLGTWLARRLTPERALVPGIVVWLAFAAATLITLLSIPHPWWMWPAGLLTCFLAGVLGLGLAAPRQNHIAIQRQIAAPLERVFQTIARTENFVKAIPDIVSIEVLSAQRYGVGTRFRETRMMHGKPAIAEMEITEQQENQLVRLESRMAGTHWNTLFTVKPVGGQVQLEMLMTATPENFLAKLATPFMMGMIERAIAGDMEHVKSHCEQAE